MPYEYADQRYYRGHQNYVFLQQEINIKIADKAPCEYMSEVFRQCETKEPIYGGIVDKDELVENLRQSCIPKGFEHMDIDDYPAFLEERRRLMAQKIKEYYWAL